MCPVLARAPVPVGGGQQSIRERQSSGVQAARVTAAVRLFVVVAGDRQSHPTPGAVEHLCGEQRM